MSAASCRFAPSLALSSFRFARYSAPIRSIAAKLNGQAVYHPFALHQSGQTSLVGPQQKGDERKGRLAAAGTIETASRSLQVELVGSDGESEQFDFLAAGQEANANDEICFATPRNQMQLDLAWCSNSGFAA